MAAVCLSSKSELQLCQIPFQSNKERATQILARSLREEGFRFLFKGWTPAFIRLGPNTVLLFVFFEVWVCYGGIYFGQT